MIEIGHLEQLVAFAEHGTLFEAAKSLSLSQPSLTRSMKKLESDLGVKLFDRKSNRVTLNENGLMAVEEARKLLALMGEMTKRIQDFDRRNKTIAIGSCAPTPARKLVGIMEETYPGANVNLSIKPLNELMEKLDTEEFDIVVLPESIDHPDWEGRYFCSEHVKCLLPKSHPLSGSSSISCKDLDGSTCLVLSETGFWDERSHKLLPHSRLVRQEEEQDFLEVINASTLLAFTSEHYSEEIKKVADRVAIPIADDEAGADYFCYIRKSSLSQLKDFQKALRNNFQMVESA